GDVVVELYPTRRPADLGRRNLDLNATARPDEEHDRYQPPRKALHRGKHKIIVVPCPIVLSARTLPPCRTMIFLTIDNPRPLPPSDRKSTRLNSSHGSTS